MGMFLRRGIPRRTFSSLAVGATIKLNVNGTPWEFLVVHQGLPSDIYDASCDGTWLLMKDIYEEREWNSSNVNKYETSTINTWLNEDFLGLLDNKIQNAIKQVKIPYRKSGGKGTDQSGANGLACKVFLLGGYEVGFTASAGSFPVDGARLDYFESGTNAARVAYMNGTATQWNSRSPNTANSSGVYGSSTAGAITKYTASTSVGIRPAFIMPSDFVVTSDMLVA